MLPPNQDPGTLHGPVLLYDGDCRLCTALVKWLRKRGRGSQLRYVPLQAPVAQSYLIAQGLATRDFDSLVFVPDGARPAQRRYLLRTDGLFAAIRLIGGPLRLVAWLRVLPRPIRDAIYSAVARLRHRVPLHRERA